MNEFLDWLEENKEHFKGYNEDEISKVSIVFGWPESVVRQWQIRQHFQKGA